MAPITGQDASSAPLADWFFIAGVDSEQLRWGREGDAESEPLPTPSEPTIQEDTQEEEVDAPPDLTPIRLRNTKRNSYQRLSKLSNDTRLSIASLQSLTQEAMGRASNRSSTTIKGIQINGIPTAVEDDFEKALRKFASERDSFLSGLALTAGAVVPNRPRPRPQTQKIVNEDSQGLRAGLGSIRRRISTRNVGGMKRQPSVGRQASVRTSRRLSNYNSVIPTPQPLSMESNTHPLKHRFEPVLLDRYPPKDMVGETRRRPPFPDYVPMFTFPNDVSIVSSDERPRSTWHGFAMTSSDNSRLYGICLIVWIPLNERSSEELEKTCERWRRDNMTDEERELASSLGQRLADERVKLSRLLAKLPSVSSGSEDREALEDEISAVEEKIALMADLLRPVRHGAAAKIEGLTDGETGIWIPRAYGILGRDRTLTPFWKEWLRAVSVPMTDGAILRVPPSSPKIGIWQPLERYVINLCAEAVSPISSLTQVEVMVRELKLYARREAANELPGSRNTDLYALFRALSIPNIVVLFEFALAESRIILLSSYTSMLHLASKALAELLYPITWSGVFIPILPARLLQALDAPCPYIVGIERRYENVELPEDDFVLVDLDQDEIESTTRPTPMPRQQRRKLTSLLQLAAPQHNRYGVPTGPPAYTIEAFPNNAFASENPNIFTPYPPSTGLSKYASLTSAAFGGAETLRSPVYNAFLPPSAKRLAEQRPSTSSTTSPPSPTTSNNLPALPTSPLSRTGSISGIQATLREKRSGQFDTSSKRSSLYGFDRAPTIRRPSIPFSGTSSGHSSSPSTTTISTSSFPGTSMYAPSTYAQSTLAASTIMPNMLMKPVHNSDTITWVEGHCFQWKPNDLISGCAVCEEKAENGIYRCVGCSINVHGRCAHQISIVCTSAFHPEQVRAAFVRCFASMFYTYRKYLTPAAGPQKKAGMLHTFNMDGFLRSMPRENAEYLAMLRQTQGFNEFIHERESKPANDPSIMLFDQIILSKRNRGRTSLFSKSKTDFLSDTSDHLWRTASASPPKGKVAGDYRTIVTRTPAKLDPTLMREPRLVQGLPARMSTVPGKRKPIPSMLGPKGRLNGLAISPPD